MSWEAWLTLVVVASAVFLMARDLLTPAIAVLGGTVVLLLAGVLTTDQAFSGFSNAAPLTVAALYVVAAAASKSGLLQPLAEQVLDSGVGDRRNLARALPPIAAASAVLNNTPIVAMLVPEISEWASRHRRHVSRMLMPVSFAAILGGTVTLIGTTTNLVVSGLLEDSGLEPLGFFELTALGLPIAVIGLVMVVWLAPRLLPARESVSRKELTQGVREFVVDVRVVGGGPLDGSTVEAGGLRHLDGVFLVQIDRASDTIAPVSPEMKLRGGDRLRFVGEADNAVDLFSIPGLLAENRGEEVDGFDLADSSFFEAVVGPSSPLVGRTLRDLEFRSHYQAAVVAINRAGQRIDTKLGDVSMRVGDTLVVLADVGFRDRWGEERDFLLVSPLSVSPARRPRHRAAVALIIAGVVAATVLADIPVLKAALGGALAVLVLRVLSPREARRAVDLEVILLIAGGFGLGEAMLSSGLAEALAGFLSATVGKVGAVGAIASIVLLTVALTETVSNTASALIMFPIALSTAAELALEPRGFAIAIALAASASFLTPVGYQTNTMVYGPGGYRYGDYVRMGLPLSITVITVVIVGVPVLWPL